MSTEDKNSVAFEVEFKKNPNAPIPDHIKAKLVEEAGKNLSEDELRAKLNAKLEAAEERKKKMEEEKAAKAAQEVAHAKQVVEEHRRLSDAQKAENLAKLQENLDNAEARREEAQKERLEKVAKLDKKPTP
ncbi:hypothetical protein RclHR1_03520002 [Rhizophagus clarus]|uniref:Stathmin n=1 Tax=Rhizophagus clarus TaxID=94130 RepID=A0A2Z6REI0_9GLOM|nr:hypothetical protein RclHR1_03520002 [Rhizophagus clarus]